MLLIFALGLTSGLVHVPGPHLRTASRAVPPVCALSAPQWLRRQPDAHAPVSVAAPAPAAVRFAKWKWHRVATAGAAVIAWWVAGVVLRGGVAFASGGGNVAASLAKGRMSRSELIGRTVLWAVLFTFAALFAGAETAITTLWPWKVKQLALDEAVEEVRSGRPGSQIFQKLTDDITKVNAPIPLERS